MEASNIEKLRNIMDNISRLNDEWFDTFPTDEGQTGIHDALMYEVMEADKILAAPLRNCDVGTAEEQERRWHSNCGSGIPNCKHCKVYEQARKSGLVDDKNMIRFDCRFIWSQMPYEETKGEAK